MAFCINCGQQLADGAKFCSGCGTAVNETNQSTQRKAIYDGEIHKCPNCGEVLNSFVSNCPACGYELRGAKNSNAVQEFALKLEQIENSRNNKGNAFSGLKNKVNKFGSVDSVDEQKISLIRSFSIPNTREDIYEFMILAASNIDLKLYGMAYHSSQFQGMLVASQRAVSDAWLAKFEQAYQKAQLLFTDCQELLSINELYVQKMKEMQKKKRELPLFVVGMVGSMVLILLIIWIPLTFGFNSSDDYDIKIAQENERLENIVSEVYIAIEEENYVLARAKTANLVFYGPTTFSGEQAAEKWDETRDELQEIINKAEYGSDYVSTENSSTKEPESSDASKSTDASSNYANAIDEGVSAFEDKINIFENFLNGIGN